MVTRLPVMDKDTQIILRTPFKDIKVNYLETTALQLCHFPQSGIVGDSSKMFNLRVAPYFKSLNKRISTV